MKVLLSLVVSTVLLPVPPSEGQEQRTPPMHMEGGMMALVKVG